MQLLQPIKLNIAQKLGNKEYRNKFFQSRARDEIASQIRELRNKRRLTQSKFAAESGMKQSAVSRIEQANYSGWSFKTLLRVAEVLDARLRVTFEPAEDVIKEYRQKEANDFISGFQGSTASGTEIYTSASGIVLRVFSRTSEPIKQPVPERSALHVRASSKQAR